MRAGPFFQDDFDVGKKWFGLRTIHRLLFGTRPMCRGGGQADLFVSSIKETGHFFVESDTLTDCPATLLNDLGCDSF